MSKIMKWRFILILVLCVAAWAFGTAGPAGGGQSGEAVRAVKGEVLATTELNIDFSAYKITFIELGADRCIPCKKMQPVMKEIAAEFADSVQVIFYDVWKDQAPGRKYGTQLIPTQVFLDSQGKEFFRHTGFFSKEEIVEVLNKQGVKKTDTAK